MTALSITSASTPSGRARKVLVFLLIVLLSKNVSAGAADWLMRINSAANEVNFSGAFVYIHNGKIDAMEVARRITKDGMTQEHLRSLNGMPREVIKDADNVWYYTPDRHDVVRDYRQTRWRGFPKILASDFQQLERYYRFVDGVDDFRIANRMAHQIHVVPKDFYRYGYRLWADKATGLLLRSDLIDQQGEAIEQYLFINVEIGKEITDEQLAAVSNKRGLHVLGKNIPVATPLESSDWRFTQVPDGYTLSKHLRRVSPVTGLEVEHLLYTDGLSSVSIFIKERQEARDEMSGLSRMGAVHAYRKSLNNYRITVMGEVPAKTVEYLAQGVVYLSIPDP